MLDILLEPPGLYVLLVLIGLLSVVGYWNRKWLKRHLRIKEVRVGPVTVEPKEKKPAAHGVDFGTSNEYSDATIKDVVGGSRVPAQSTSQKINSSVDFGSDNTYSKANIEGITGGDVVDNQPTTPAS